MRPSAGSPAWRGSAFVKTRCRRWGRASWPARRDVSVRVLDPDYRRRPRRGLPGDRASADDTHRLAPARRAPDRAAGGGTGDGALRVLSGAKAAVVSVAAE